MFYFFASPLWAKYNVLQISDDKLIFFSLISSTNINWLLSSSTVDKELNIRGMETVFTDSTFEKGKRNSL